MTNLHYHTQERFLVLGPQSGELLSRGEQTAAGVDRDLRTVSKVHAEVLGGHGETRWLTDLISYI